MSQVRFTHVNVIARDWRLLAKFYEQALGCTRVGAGPERDLKGEWIQAATHLPPNLAHIKGAHLRLPGYPENSGPTLEVFQYPEDASQAIMPSAFGVNVTGFRHIAFAVPDVRATLEKVLQYGGSSLGEVVDLVVEGVGPITFVYCRDPEGNILEIQKWH